MDWTPALETQRLALLRLVMALAAVLRVGARVSEGRRPIMPRFMRLPLVRLVRPAEAAARRLVAIAAHLESLRPPDPTPMRARGGRQSVATRQPAAPSLPLADPFPDPARHRPFRLTTRGRPRITFLDEPAHVAEARERALEAAAAAAREARRVREEDATRLARRLRALRLALEDLPAQARRLMRWHAGQARRRLANRPNRLSPIRHGRPKASVRRGRHPLHELLDICHGLFVNLPDPAPP